MKFDKSRNIDVICMGRVAVDLYAEQIGCALRNVTSFKKYLGGSAGNIAVGCSRQRLNVAMLSCVGRDEMGQFLLDTLHKENVVTDFVRQSSKHLTGLVLLGIEPPDKFPLLFYREQCADMQIKASQITPQQLAQSKTLLITATRLSQPQSRDVTDQIVNMAKSVGTKIIVDLDYRPVLWGLTNKGNGESRYFCSEEVTRHYQDLLCHCDLIVGTEEEFAIAGGHQVLSKNINTLNQLTAADLVVKKGSQGCVVYSQDKIIQGEAFQVDVLNVLGAGDAFMSGLLGQLLTNQSWQQAASYANACGAIVVTRHSCSDAIPRLDEVQYFIQKAQEIPPQKVLADNQFLKLQQKNQEFV